MRGTFGGEGKIILRAQRISFVLFFFWQGNRCSSGHRLTLEGEEEEEEEEDEGDPYDFLWIELMGGVSYVDLRAIDQNNYYPTFVKLSGIGPMGGLALGFRIEFLSFGVRGALAHYDDGFDVGTAVAEVTLALPIPIVKPFIRVGFGMGWHGDSDVENSLGEMGARYPDNVQTTVFGFAFSGAVGLDIYLAHWFSIGAAATVDILNMNRQSTEEPIEDPMDVSEVLAKLMAEAPVEARNLAKSLIAGTEAAVGDEVGGPIRVAYHAACSLQHGQKIKTHPKALLSAAGFEVVEPADSHLCCGSAGTYNLMQPEISGQLKARKVRTLEAKAPDVIAAGNIGCMMQIGSGTGVPVVHTVELLDWASGGPKPAALG